MATEKQTEKVQTVTGADSQQLAADHAEGLMDKLVSLCKRRGFIYQSSEIYGGVGAV